MGEDSIYKSTCVEGSWPAFGTARESSRESLRALLPLLPCLLCSARARSCQLSRAAVGLSQPVQDMGDAEQCLLCLRSWDWRPSRMECRAGTGLGTHLG